MPASETIFKLYRMEDDRISGECVEFKNIDMFKEQLRIDYKGEAALCFTINDFYTRHANELEAELDNTVNNNVNEIIVYNYPNIPVNVRAIFATGEEAHFVYNVSSKTMKDLILDLQNQDDIKQKFVEACRKIPEANSLSDYKLIEDALKQSNTAKYDVRCEKYSSVEDLVVDCIGDEKYPEILIFFPKLFCTYEADEAVFI
ncbi:hypothetical protein BX667DRAFT_494965, partial [Coemansia mojavensis]